MTAGCLDGLIDPAASTNNTKRVAVHKFLRGQKGKGSIDVAGHLLLYFLLLLLEIGKLSALAAAEGAEIKGEDVVAGGAQHRSKLIVNLPIGVALVQQKKSGARLSSGKECSLQHETVGSGKAHFSLPGGHTLQCGEENNQKYEQHFSHS